jgi:hypothetical protein
MQMLFSSPNGPEVGLLKDLLDGAGIACELRNDSSSANFPGAAFQAEVWVVNETDFAKACEVRDAYCLSLPPGASQPFGGNIEEARSNAFLCAFTGTLLLVAAGVLACQFSRRGDWLRCGGILTVFGLLGGGLLWSGVGRLRRLRKNGQ